MTTAPERIWADRRLIHPVCKGYPGATEYVRADIHAALQAECDSLEAAIKRQAGAAKTLRKLTLDEVADLKARDRSEYFAEKTLQGEKNTNAMLTEALETAEAERDALRAALEWYGEQARTCRMLTREGERGRIMLHEDGGKRAREALGKPVDGEATP